MIEVKRDCSSSVRDTGDKIIVSSFTVRITDDDYIRFRVMMNEYNCDAPKLIQWMIESELVE